jgi:hypothetical protein
MAVAMFVSLLMAMIMAMLVIMVVCRRLRMSMMRSNAGFGLKLLHTSRM